MIFKKTKPDINKEQGNGLFLIFAIPGFVYLLINNFIPMLIGLVVAFKDVNFRLGILKSPWSGLKNFRYLFKTEDAWIITRNTVLYNLAFIVLSTVIALGIALLINEVKQRSVFKTYQGIMLLPHLISMLIVSYLVFAFLSVQSGFVNNTVLPLIGKDIVAWYSEPGKWPSIIVYVYCWKHFGYTSLIYYAAIANIDQSLYEAAEIDGANRWQKAFKVTIPMIKSTIAVMVLLAIGRIFSSEFGLFYQVPMDSGALYPTINVIDTYVYRALLKSGNIGMSAAACLYQSVVGCVIFIGANYLVRKVSPDNSLY